MVLLRRSGAPGAIIGNKRLAHMNHTAPAAPGARLPARVFCRHTRMTRQARQQYTNRYCAALLFVAASRTVCGAEALFKPVLPRSAILSGSSGAHVVETVPYAMALTEYALWFINQ